MTIQPSDLTMFNGPIGPRATHMQKIIKFTQLDPRGPTRPKAKWRETLVRHW